MPATISRTARNLALVLSVLAFAGLAAAAPAAPTAPTKEPAAQDAKAHRPVVAVTDWIAADAVRLLAGSDIDVVVVPGLGLAAPARKVDAPKPGGAVVRPGTQREGEAKVTLAPDARAAIDAADAFVSTNEARDVHLAVRGLCPTQGALVSAIRPQQRVTRADGSVEPAFWTDAALWARTVIVARQTLAKVAPAQDQALKDRAKDARNTLLALNDEMLTSLATLPKDTVLIVGAEGLGQLARVHQLEVRVVPKSLDSQADREAMREIVDLVIARKIPAAFPVDGVINANLDELVTRVKARGGQLRIAHPLHVDTPAPGDDGSAGAVERMIRYNARTIRDAFTTQGLPSAK